MVRFHITTCSYVLAPPFICPYCPRTGFHLHDVPSTSERFSGYDNYGNSSPEPYTLGRSSSDISLPSPQYYDHIDSPQYFDIDNIAYEGSNEQGSNEYLGESVVDTSKGLPEWKISKLPTHKYGKNTKSRWWWQKKKTFVADDTQCSICLVDYEKGDKMITLPCKHIYHKDCISRWLKENRVCCVCKRVVF